MGGEDAFSALLIPIIIGVIHFRNAQSKSPLPTVNSFTLTGIACYILLWIIDTPALIKASVAITVLLHHHKLLKNFGISALAFLSLPWLSSFQYFFGSPLQKFIAKAGALTINSTGLPVTAIGTGISFQDQVVYVDPPCSGVKMLWSILILTASISVLYKLSWKQGIALSSLSVLFAIIGNILRASILFFPESNLVTWPAWTHQAIGCISYIGICLLLITSVHLFTRNHGKKISTRYIYGH